ncbi:Uncharacterised protein [Mycobacteroides abscessus subsp. abscessus]|nr:Uncharacterised protein [Mycobacteroides abscessus subsp. abscessus]
MQPTAPTPRSSSPAVPTRRRDLAGSARRSSIHCVPPSARKPLTYMRSTIPRPPTSPPPSTESVTPVGKSLRRRRPVPGPRWCSAGSRRAPRSRASSPRAPFLTVSPPPRCLLRCLRTWRIMLRPLPCSASPPHGSCAPSALPRSRSARSTSPRPRTCVPPTTSCATRTGPASTPTTVTWTVDWSRKASTSR